MLRFTRFPIILSIASLFIFSVADAQTPQRESRPRTASISGRVTVGGAPAANALVMVAEVEPQSRAGWPVSSINEPQHRQFFKVRTNGDGRYRVTGLTDGAYMIRALSKAHILPQNSSEFEIFRTIMLDEGESRDNVDIALVRGGVITGRVTDVEGRPLIGADLQLLPLDENGNPKREGNFGDYWMFRTDDRGVYRIYGLPAGRYLLSAGGEGGYGAANRKSPRTYYPDVTDQKLAKIIDVKEGAEAADININIRLGAAKNTYAATGRVIDAVTGQPLPRISVMVGGAPDNENARGRSWKGAETDGEGRFRVTGLLSGGYELGLWNQHLWNGEHYSEKIRFEVSDSDVSGLEVKAIRGATISGVVVIEGANDPSIRAKLPQMAISVGVSGGRESAGDRAYEIPGMAYSQIASDGGFRLTGLAPGMASFQVQGEREGKFLIKRIEHDGAEIKSALEIGRSEQVTGVRVVVVEANGTIRGQVEIAGGKLPKGWELHIVVTPIEPTTDNVVIPAFYTNRNGYAVADEKGRFMIERLVPGEYELTLNPMVRLSRSMSRGVDGTDEIGQRITVNSGVETPVKLTLDLSRKQQEEGGQ